MNRRDFIKKSVLFSMGAIAFGKSQVAYAAMKKIPQKRIAKLRKISLTDVDFQNIGSVTLKLVYKDVLPEEISVSVTSKNGTILGRGTPIFPTSPSVADKVENLPDQTKVVTLRISPELIDAGRYILLDIVHKGVGFQLLKLTIKVEKPRILDNNHSIEGYIPKVCYLPQEVMELKVHSPLTKFSVDFVRFGADERVIHTIKNISGSKQSYPEYAYRNGANWNTSYRFTIPADWTSGLYGARIYDASGKDFYISFNIKGSVDFAVPKQKRIIVLSSTNTWQAYNIWGGGSFYKYLLDDDIKPIHGQMVHTQRPNVDATPIGHPVHLANAEKFILAWLERNGYTYQVIADADLHENPDILKSYGTLIINTHGEYWTETMYDGLEAFLEKGGNLATLSANSVYWKTVQKDHHLEARKLFGYHTLTGERGGLWNNLKRPESKVLGVRYTPTGYLTFHPYKVIKPKHWVFAGTGLKKGDLMGEVGLNRGGASGHETDKIDKSSPHNVVLLAKGTNPEDGGGEMVYYDHPSGGGVFSAGSVTFGGSLVVDRHLSQILENVLNRFTLGNSTQTDIETGINS